jgi:hypothetical protein
VRAGLRVSVAAAIRNAGIARMPAGRGLAPLADIPDRERRDGPPELLIRRKHPVIAMPMLPRRRDKIGQTIEELKRREFDDAPAARPLREVSCPGSLPPGAGIARSPARRGGCRRGPVSALPAAAAEQAGGGQQAGGRKRDLRRLRYGRDPAGASLWRAAACFSRDDGLRNLPFPRGDPASATARLLRPVIDCN